jgi:anti-sigma-K factor RskA
MRCEHEHDDGAYVLGALSPAERAAYERHLASCSFCREAVADIAVLPGLLGRLDAAEFAQLLDPTLSTPAPERSRMPDLVTAAQRMRRKERRRLRVRVLTTALAAAVVALIVGVGAMFWMYGRVTPSPPAAPGPVVAMAPVDDDIPVSADVSLTGTSGGTKVNLVCVYRKNPEYRKSYTVRLVAYGPDNEADSMGSWVAAPGKEFSMSGVTHFPLGSLSRLELVRNDGQALLAYDVP